MRFNWKWSVIFSLAIVALFVASMPTRVAEFTSAQELTIPQGDYGDAPDGILAGYSKPFGRVIGNFPTLYGTTNSRFPGSPGAHALNVGQEWLGPANSQVSSEAGANDPNDPDKLTNLVDDDAFDNGLLSITLDE